MALFVHPATAQEHLSLRLADWPEPEEMPLGLHEAAVADVRIRGRRSVMAINGRTSTVGTDPAEVTRGRIGRQVSLHL